MFWLHRHLPAKQALNSKQSAKGYERMNQGILRRSGYFTSKMFFFGMVVLHNFYVDNYVGNSRYDLKNYVHFAFQRIFFAKTMLFGYLLMVKKLCMLLLMILKSKVLDGKSMEMVTMPV